MAIGMSSLRHDQKELVHIGKKSVQVFELFTQLFHDRAVLIKKTVELGGVERLAIDQKDDLFSRLKANIDKELKVIKILLRELGDAMDAVHDIKRRLRTEKQLDPFYVKLLAFLDELFAETVKYTEFLEQKERLYHRHRDTLPGLFGLVRQQHGQEHAYLQRVEEVIDQPRLLTYEKQVHRFREWLKRTHWGAVGAVVGGGVGYALSFMGVMDDPTRVSGPSPDAVKEAMIILGLFGMTIGFLIALRKAFAAAKHDFEIVK